MDTHRPVKWGWYVDNIIRLLTYQPNSYLKTVTLILKLKNLLPLNIKWESSLFSIIDVKKKLEKPLKWWLKMKYVREEINLQINWYFSLQIYFTGQLK